MYYVLFNVLTKLRDLIHYVRCINNIKSCKVELGAGSTAVGTTLEHHRSFVELVSRRKVQAYTFLRESVRALAYRGSSSQGLISCEVSGECRQPLRLVRNTSEAVASATSLTRLLYHYLSLYLLLKYGLTRVRQRTIVLSYRELLCIWSNRELLCMWAGALAPAHIRCFTKSMFFF